MLKDLKSKIILLISLLFFAGAVSLLSSLQFSMPLPNLSGMPTVADMIREGKAPIPEYTEETAAKLAKSKGFSALVSYTDNGFEPKTVTIKKGEAIRFTNNSSHDVWIAAGGTNVQIYPRTEDVCGSSNLDSCEPFAPQDFWEFSFEVPGEWHVVNNLDKSRGGTVIVE